VVHEIQEIESAMAALAREGHGGLVVPPEPIEKRNAYRSDIAARRLISPRSRLRCRRWCGRKDLNLHGLPHLVLSQARPPVPPRPRHRATTASQTASQAI
jgi:hypothetical protein